MHISRRLLRKCATAAVREHILGTGEWPESAGLQIPTGALLAGLHDYLARCIVRERELERVAALLWARVDSDRFELEDWARFMEFEPLKELHDALDELFYQKYFSLSCVHTSACLMLRLNGLVNAQFAQTAQQLFGDSALRENLPAVLEGRRVRSRALQLFVENCTLDTPQYRRSATGRSFEERLRLVKGRPA